MHLFGRVISLTTRLVSRSIQKELGMDEFDYIVVGAGSAGCVIANRLTAAGASVCVLEAGPRDRNFYIRMPVGYVKNLSNPNMTWQLKTEGSWGTNGRELTATQGKVLGGTSAINGLAFVRGQPSDYDSWQAQGNAGWSYADVLAYFRRSERRLGPHDPAFRGKDGPIPVSDADWRSPLSEAFVASAGALGIPANSDYNANSEEGAGYYQRTIERARRVSAAKAYLHPLLHRTNISLRTNVLVRSLILEGKRATGVIYESGTDLIRVKARREVILCAGALNTPKLLELSGIGSPKVLSQAGIAVAHELSGVGENLQDHYGVRLVARVKGATTINELVKWPHLGLEFLRWLVRRNSVLGISAVMCYAFTKSDPSLAFPDATIMFTPASYKNGQLGVLDDYPGVTIGGWQMRPESVGYVHIRSTAPAVAPIIQPNYLRSEADRAAVIGIIRKARAILHASPFSRYLVNEVFPGEQLDTDDALLDFARQAGAVIHHWCGSCRMGPADRKDSVVSDRLLVHGMEGLRIVDASVFPSMISGNTYATVLMVAEKAADMILGKTIASTPVN